ncbi:DUF4012 domain-containing protein [Herbiconiux sp. L3-i23]|uniref:DUF4012 domain-containing protein n=1 Tax=Herbiconiux sp. L3-i23 TaxID=2905871 RepID=UPI002062D1DF|nr:DUF4012 domain-containing protein [Herbiconiux sp. L3-i23]BDI21638.1 hypothetical protein L3i23_04140 [Herbiconiux sp. L3-i23]
MAISETDDRAAPRAPRGAVLRWRRPTPWIVFALVVVAVLLAAAATWIGVRAVLAKDALDRAQALVSELRSSISSDPTSAPALATRIVAETRTARDLTSDPIWAAGEAVPFVGANLAVVRELAGTVDEVATGAIAPLAGVVAALDPSALRPVDGRIDLAPIAAAAGPAAEADDAVTAARERLRALDSEGVIGQVRDARNQLLGLLDEAAPLTGAARTLTELAPSMLGADGPRDYLLMFQNNAEARSLGGNPAAFVLLHVDQGAIGIAAEASSLDFPRDGEPPLELDPNLYSVYYADFSRYVMDITTRPDFPTAASLAKAYWERRFGGTVDGVVSMDPVALSYLLRATGPVPLATGDELTADNAVALLLSEVYARYTDPAVQDAFFASAASAVFGAVTTGAFDPAVALPELTRAVDERRLLLWSADSKEQAIIATTPLSGILPTMNDDETAVGVFFMDQSSSKMDYYLGTSVTASSDQCEADAPTFEVGASLTSKLTQEQADALPAYVTSTWWGSEKFVTDVYLVGPVGATFAGVAGDGTVVSSGTDLGRPVVRVQIELRPGETKSVNGTFAAPAGDFGPLAVIGTPMVVPTTVTTSTPGC